MLGTLAIFGAGSMPGMGILCKDFGRSFRIFGKGFGAYPVTLIFFVSDVVLFTAYFALNVGEVRFHFVMMMAMLAKLS
jgi:hypothetical protein